MKHRVPAAILCVVSLWGAVGCGGGTGKSGGKPEKTAPAKVEAHPDESDIFRVTLTPKAVERLGITTAAVARQSVPRSREVGGIVTVPPGQSLILAAPVTGRVEIPKEGVFPKPGSEVRSGDPLLVLIPMLSPERDVPTPAERVQMANAQVALSSAQVNAAGDLQRADAEVEAARIALERARRLFADMAGSARDVDDAQAAYNVAEKTRDAARARKQVLDALTLQADEGEVRPVPLLAPEDGTLMNVSVTPGQTVTLGASLLEIADLQTLWVRVPLYAGQLDEIPRGAPAQVRDLRRTESATRTAAPVDAPPSGDPLAASVDLFYELPNPDGELRPGQRVSVQLPLQGEAESLVIPLAAVLHDVNGTAWVYVQDEETVFRRHRVLMRFTAADPATGAPWAVLQSGPPVGTKVVVDGAAELFGTEFGTGK